MKLLLVTQVVDSTDTYLGFFHRWIEELAPHFERIEVACLYEGVHSLPENVHVHSLGKEKGKGGPIVYAARFLALAWRLRRDYDRVFIHMNEEYVLIGGLFWKALGKPVYLWRNHYAGSWRTQMAAALSTKVFHTSIHSYTARFRNAVRMPVGVDTALYNAPRTAPKSSVLFFGRFSRSKRPDLFIDALRLLKERGVAFIASVYGSAVPEEASYREVVEQSASGLNVEFYEGIPHEQTPEVFARHELYVNLGASGMLDKTLFEAAISGTKVLARSDDWRALMGDAWHIADDSPETLADAIEGALKAAVPETLQEVAQDNSLDSLMVKLVRETAVQ